MIFRPVIKTINNDHKRSQTIIGFLLLVFALNRFTYNYLKLF